MDTSAVRCAVVFCLIASIAAVPMPQENPLQENPNGAVNEGACPHDRWVFFEDNCYLFVHEQYTWFDAEATCHYMDAKLAEMESEAENQFVANFVQSHNVLAAWIGLTDFGDEGNFVWTYSRQPPEQTFWYPGEPTDSGADEDCVYIWKEAMWVDQNCENYKHPFVCEAPAREGPPVGR